MPKAEKMARQAAHHYFRSTDPQLQDLAQVIEDSMGASTLLEWSNKYFLWEPKQFMPHTAATKYAQLVELYWHV